MKEEVREEGGYGGGRPKMIGKVRPQGDGDGKGKEFGVVLNCLPCAKLRPFLPFSAINFVYMT